MIDHISQDVIFFLWGNLLGLLFFGGLWLTVRRLSIVSHKTLWILSSFIFRNLLVASGFYLVVLQSLRATLICLAGFILIRFIFTHRIKLKLDTNIKERG